NRPTSWPWRFSWRTIRSSGLILLPVPGRRIFPEIIFIVVHGGFFRGSGGFFRLGKRSRFFRSFGFLQEELFGILDLLLDPLLLDVLGNLSPGQIGLQILVGAQLEAAAEPYAQGSAVQLEGLVGLPAQVTDITDR